MNIKDAKKILAANQQTYNAIASEFSKTRNKPLWPVLNNFKKYVKNSDKILDLGCGNGRLMSLFDDVKVDYTGLDLCESFVESAKSKTFFVNGDMLDLPFKDSQFNVIFMIASLNHLTSHYHYKALSEAYRVLKPGGYLCTTNFNLWRFSWKDKTVWSKKTKLLSRKLSFLSKDVITRWSNHPLYYYAFTLRELKRKFKQVGFKTKQAYYSKYGKKAYIWDAFNLVVVAKK